MKTEISHSAEKYSLGLINMSKTTKGGDPFLSWSFTVQVKILKNSQIKAQVKIL